MRFYLKKGVAGIRYPYAAQEDFDEDRGVN
jgi:hypothetical protein